MLYTMSMKRKAVLLSIMCVGVVAAGIFALFFMKSDGTPTMGNRGANDLNSLPFFTEAELAKYDGTDPQLPIYIGLNGYVYDVSEGKKYYAPEGAYHYLAGKDSSKSLRMIGGDIIKSKYPVVGILRSARAPE